LWFFTARRAQTFRRGESLGPLPAGPRKLYDWSILGEALLTDMGCVRASSPDGALGQGLVELWWDSWVLTRRNSGGMDRFFLFSGFIHPIKVYFEGSWRILIEKIRSLPDTRGKNLRCPKALPRKVPGCWAVPGGARRCWRTALVADSSGKESSCGDSRGISRCPQILSYVVPWCWAVPGGAGGARRCWRCRRTTNI